MNWELVLSSTPIDPFLSKTVCLNTIWQKELERQLEQENEELKARDEISEYEQPLAGDENHDEDNVMYQNYPTGQEHAATQG